jgi:magnesium transporter
MSAVGTGNELGDKILAALERRNPPALRRMLARLNFADLSEVLENVLTVEQAVAVFQLLAPGQAALVLTCLDEERQEACLLSLSSNKGSRVLRLMAADDAVDILQRLSQEDRRRILGEMPFDADTRTLHTLLMEAPDTAAGIMSTDYISLSVEDTVGDAMQLIRQAQEKDFIYYVYLVDTNQRLVGVVGLKKLVLHDESVPLARIATFDVKSILVSYDQEFAANLFRKYYNLLAMPVVDADETLRGIITLDDILEVIDEESSEDIYQASGISLEDMDERNLLTGPVLNAVKARMPWLGVTLVGQLIASMIVASHQDTVSKAVIAFSFMPLLSGLSGNIGTQSDTIAVRGLALNLINDDNFLEKFKREVRVALTIATTFAVFVSLFALFRYQHWELSVLLFVSMTAGLTLSACLGISLPYLIQRYFKFDPAGVCGPFITTFLDMTTYAVYLTIITLILDRLI